MKSMVLVVFLLLKPHAPISNNGHYRRQAAGFGRYKVRLLVFMTDKSTVLY